MSSGLGGDRYITPEYLAPLPQKDGMSDKSPLQMLAQTCSQIGADPGPKLLEKHKQSTSSSKSNAKCSSPTIVVSDSKPVPFKPYETTKDIKAKAVESKRASENGSSKSVSPHVDTRSPRESQATDMNNGTKSVSPKHQTISSSSSEAASTTPIMSSGLEILAGHPKDLPLGTFRPPLQSSVMDLNPAFRMPSTIPGLGGYPHPPVASHSGSSSVCRDPYCKDPGCPIAVYNAYMARLRLPPGYLELLEAHKLASLPPSPAMPPTSLSASASLGPGGPYICNWMNGRDYCGKRYSSAEELLVHLKTHTNLSTSDSGYAGLLRGAPSQLLPSPLSLQANRYSPYQRPGAAALPPSLSSLGALPPSPLTGLPPSLASSLPYPASLYALYGARL